MNQRKHYSQMTQSERMSIEAYAHGLATYRWQDNPHLIERQREKRITDAELILALRKGKVVEAHINNYPEIRFVLRYIVNNRAICVCASHHGKVVTAWANNATDNHRTLDRTQYQWKEDLTRVFDTLKG